MKQSNPEKLQSLELAEKFISLAQEPQLEMVLIKWLLNKNHRLILKQTENRETAPLLQTAMNALSARIRIEDFALSSQLSDYVSGLYCEDKAPWNELFDELWGEIFKHCVPRGPFKKWERTLTSRLESAVLVSKNWYKIAKEAKYKWVREESISLRSLFSDPQDAINYILSQKSNYINAKKLPRFDLTYLSPTDEQLAQLQQTWPEVDLKILLRIGTFDIRPLVRMLEIDHSASKDQLIAVLKKAPNLRCLRIPAEFELFGDKLKEILSWIPNLKKLSVSTANMSPAELAQALAQTPNLEVLEIDAFELYSDVEELAQVFKAVPNLKNFSFDEADFEVDAMERILASHLPLRKLKWVHNDEAECGNFTRGFQDFSNLKSLKMKKWPLESQFF